MFLAVTTFKPPSMSSYPELSSERSFVGSLHETNYATPFRTMENTNLIATTWTILREKTIIRTCSPLLLPGARSFQANLRQKTPSPI